MPSQKSAQSHSNFTPNTIPESAWKFTPEDSEYKDKGEWCWICEREIRFMRDTLIAAGYSGKLNDLQVCEITLKLLNGYGFRFKGNGGKLYAIDPNFMNRLRDYYYTLKANKPSKLKQFVEPKDLNILIHLE